MMLLRFNHKVYQYFFCSFVLLSSFPLYGCDKSIRWHNFQKSIHQLTKYPGCFPFGIIMNKATMNISQNKLCSFFLDKFQGVGTLSHMVHVCWLYKKMPHRFPEWLHHFSFLLVTWEFQLLQILSNTWNYHFLLFF